MVGSLRGGFALAAALILPLLAVAQSPPSTPAKTTEPAKKETSPAKQRPTLDKLKLPTGSILVLTEDLREGQASRPKMILLTPEQYQELKDRADNLERQLHVDKKLAHSCKLSGRLEGDFVSLRAEFAFATEGPRTFVVLGLKGAHLVDEGELDHQTPLIDFGDDGFVVRVEKEGNHQLALNMRVPVEAKKAGTSERGFELELPGTAITTLALELPGSVKEVRWNDNLEKHRGGNRWHLALGKAKKLTLAWREPIALPGSGPLPSVEGQLDVRLNETHVLTEAKLDLTDLRGQTKEWRLILPPGATAEVAQAPTGISYDLVAPDGKSQHHLLRLHEPNNGTWSLSVVARQPRPAPGARLPIGPFYVEGAYRQQGTIAVQVPADLLRGQRLIYHRTGEVFQRDLPKQTTVPDLAAVFQYWNHPAPGDRGAKVPLELEIRNEQGQVETNTSYNIVLRPSPEGWEIELTTKIRQAKAILSGADTLNLQLPLPRPRGVAGFACMPGLPFPANAPWLALSEAQTQPLLRTFSGEFTAYEEGGGPLELAPLDSQGRTRFSWPHSLNGKSATAILTTRYLLPQQQQRARIDLPRPIGTLERDSRLSVTTDERVELLIGPPGAEEPVPERHSYQLALDQDPTHVDFAWRSCERELPAEAVVDITVRERTAEIREQLTFPNRPEAPGLSHSGQLRLHVPRSARNLRLGDRPLELDARRQVAWVPAGQVQADRQTLTLQYDADLPQAGDQGEARPFSPPVIWPEGVTSRSAKVRVWVRPGVRVRLSTPGAPWADRGVEAVAGRTGLPALVLQGYGAELPLPLVLEDTPGATLAALICDRALLSFEVTEDGQRCRARYLVQQVSADQLDVQFPVVAGCLQNVTLGGRTLVYELPAPNVARIQLQPELFRAPAVLELEYKVPASIAGGSGAWRTVLFPPQFRQEVLVHRTRWQVQMPRDLVGLIPSRHVRLEYRWAPQGPLLAPRALQTEGELESWFAERGPGEGGGEPALLFERSGSKPLAIYHLPQQLFLLLCSAGLLIGSLCLVYLPLPRLVFWLLVAAIALAVLAGVVLLPALMPPLAFGCQPGLAVLLVVLFGGWLLQEQYRRRVALMPGFSRVVTPTQRGSSVRRPREETALNPAPREPSTVDAPPAPVEAGLSAAPHQG